MQSTENHAQSITEYWYIMTIGIINILTLLLFYEVLYILELQH